MTYLGEWIFRNVDHYGFCNFSSYLPTRAFSSYFGKGTLLQNWEISWTFLPNWEIKEKLKQHLVCFILILVSIN